MSLRTSIAVLAALAALGTACAGDPASAPQPSTTSAPTQPMAPSAPVSETARPTPQRLVEDPGSLLADVFVRRKGGRFAVAALWACNQNADANSDGTSDECPRHFAVVRSDDGFATAEYLAGGQVSLLARLGLPRPKGAGSKGGCVNVAGGVAVCERAGDPEPIAWTDDRGATWHVAHLSLEPLVPWTVPSLRRGTFAVAGGGDGATLFPFEKVARSRDGGRTWSTYDVARTDDVMPYSSGFAVTSDGRLLALLDNWSDDRNGKPGKRVHGLYASNGTDWSTYRTLTSRFRPALTSPSRHSSPVVSLQASALPDPVIWVTTWDKLLYVSTDDGHTFRQIQAR